MLTVKTFKMKYEQIQFFDRVIHLSCIYEQYDIQYVIFYYDLRSVLFFERLYDYYYYYSIPFKCIQIIRLTANATKVASVFLVI